MELKDEEIVCYNGYPKKKKNGTISIKGIINIYTNEGCFQTEININLKKLVT